MRRDPEYWDAFRDEYERIKEIMAGDPDYNETHARMIAHGHTRKFSKIDESDASR